MPLKLGHLPASVARPLRSFYRRKRMLELLRIFAVAAAVYLLAGLLVMHLDRFLFLDQSTRVWLSYFGHLLPAELLLALLMWWIVRRPGVAQVAYELEGRLPTGEANLERYVTLDNVLARGGYERSEVSADLVAQLRAATEEHSRSLKAGRLVRDRYLRRALVAVGVLAAIWIALAIPAGYQFRLMFRRFVAPQANLPKPSFMRINVTGAGERIGRGGEAIIQAEISGEIPTGLKWLMKALGASENRAIIAVAAGERDRLDFDQAERSDMSRIRRDLFLYTRADLQESFSFRIRCGDAETRVHTVPVVAQPRIIDLKITATPPEYTGMDPQIFTDLREPIRLLKGTRVEVSFRTDQPVVERTLTFEKMDEPPEIAWDESTRTGTFAFDLTRRVSFEIAVTNDLGFSNVEPARVTIGVREDTPPVVRLEYPTTEQEKVPGELVPMQAVIDDDFGVSAVSIGFILNPTAEEARWEELPVELEQTGLKDLTVTASLDLDKTAAAPGDTLRVRVQALDTSNKYGYSREITIRVTAFARGENERKRIAALRFLADALKEIAASPKPETPTAGEAVHVGVDPWDRISKLAASYGVHLGDGSSVATLLALLAREHHFTDDALHKADVRKLRALIAAAAMPLTSDGLAEPYAWRKARTTALADGLLPPLTRYRHLKNLNWRLFGMRYEAENITAKLAELAAVDNPDDARVESLNRRAQLYLKTLQDVGEELIELSRVVDGLDTEKLTALIGELNTAGYYVRRGSIGRRLESSREVARLIAEELKLIRPALVPLLAEELAARERLDDAYDASLSRIAAGPPAEQVAPWLDNAANRLGADAGMLRRNPFAGVWAGLVDFALLEQANAARGSGGADRQAAVRNLIARGRTLLNPPDELAGAIAASDRLHDRMSLDAAVAHVRSLWRIGNTEKAYEIRLRALELAARRGAPAKQIEALFKPIAALDLSAELDDLDDAIAAAAGEPDEWRGVLENSETLLSGARSLADFPTPIERVQALLAELERTQAQLDTVSAPAEDDEAPAERMSRVGRALLAEIEAAERAVAAVALELSLRPFAADARDNEVLMLRMRDALQRYAALTAGTINALAGARGAKLSARDLTEMSAELDLLRIRHAAWIKNLYKAADAYRADEPAEDGDDAEDGDAPKYVLLEEFHRTRRYVETAVALIDSDDPTKIARAFIEEFADAAIDFIATNADLTAAARDALTAAESDLTGDPVDVEAYHARLDKAETALASMADVLAAAGEGDLQTRASRALVELRARIGRLRLDSDSPSEVAISEKLYALGDVQEQAEALLRLITAPPREREEDRTVSFMGGPAGIWDEATRYQAQDARARVREQFRYARRAAADGVFEAFSPRRREWMYQRTLAWSNWLYRLVRSELTGLGGTRRERRERERTEDPLLKFLQEELEKAMQVRDLKNYAEPTREYLESVADFLRY